MVSAGLMVLLATAVWGQTAHAQLQITPTRNAQTLVSNLVGEGINVTNASYSGGQVLDPLFGAPLGEAAGVFTNGPQEIRDGIVITNGDTVNMLPPNYVEDATGVLSPEVYLTGGVEQDPLCTKVIGSNDYDIYDPVRLTIDFTVAPGYDGLQIDYLFGSEEYPEYVGDIFADAFGFFVGEAVLPESTYTNIGLDLDGQPININGPFFSGNAVVTDGSATQYDGTTPRLTSTIRLSPGTAYRMIIVVCDAGDEYLDSGVFLAALAGCSGECDGTYVCVEGKGEESCNEDGSGPTVPNDNVAPNVQNDSTSATAGVEVRVDVLANDSDPNGDTIEVRAVSVADHGTAAVVEARWISYTPAPSFNGQETLQVQVCDPFGACAVSVLVVDVTGGTVDPGDPGDVDPVDPGDVDPVDPGDGDPGTGDPADPADPVVPTPDDIDGDGISNDEEIANGTDPNSRDTDGDGLLDGDEIDTDPLDADSDDDGIADGAEALFGTDPTKADSDGDGLPDGLETGAVTGVAAGTSSGGSHYEGTAAGAFTPDLDPSSRTDPTRYDSDDDGIADGVEDANHNGRVDEGERNPAFAEGGSSAGSERPGCAGGNTGPALLALLGMLFVLMRRRSTV